MQEALVASDYWVRTLQAAWGRAKMAHELANLTDAYWALETHTDTRIKCR